MGKRKIRYFLLSTVIFYAFFPFMVTTATPSETSVSTQGRIIYPDTSPSPSPIIPSSSPNLADIPDLWNLNGHYPSLCNEPYIFLDYSVTHFGNVSIRLDQGGPEDPYYPGVIDRATWLIRKYPAKAGDHILFKIWIKTPSNPEEKGKLNRGARAGIDGYLGSKPLSSSSSPDSQGIIEAWSTPHVKWGSDWTQVVIDTVIPSNYELDSIIAWIQVRPGEDPHSVWFADSEFYINP